MTTEVLSFVYYPNKCSTFLLCMCDFSLIQFHIHEILYLSSFWLEEPKIWCSCCCDRTLLDTCRRTQRAQEALSVCLCSSARRASTLVKRPSFFFDTSRRALLPLLSIIIIIIQSPRGPSSRSLAGLLRQDETGPELLTGGLCLIPEGEQSRTHLRAPPCT